MTIKIGEKIPSITLQYLDGSSINNQSTEELFSDKKVVLFALPGAFTPTCSASHLPGYVIKSDAFFSKGIDLIACLSVNDVFVMNAWGEQHNTNGRVMMLADGNAKFTQAVGLELNLTDNHMGVRSQRYSMLINDGVVEAINIEAAGEFEISDADSMLANL